jgi:hypothetical protein
VHQDKLIQLRDNDNRMLASACIRRSVAHVAACLLARMLIADDWRKKRAAAT